MRWSGYPEYKESGIKWLGKVPAHWTQKQLGSIAKFVGGATPSKNDLSYWNGDIPWVSPKDMKSEVVCSTVDTVTRSGLLACSASLVPAGQVLVVVRSGILRHRIPAAINDIPVALNQDMKAIILDSRQCESRFFLRFVQGLNTHLRLIWSKQGATVESLEHYYVAKTVLFVPPVDEQNQIIEFIDHETAKIDALIEEQQRLIELLAEKRQAVISHAVTQGLDPNVPMKDSDVEWLGQVPAHWETAPLKFLVETVGGGTPSKEREDYWVGDLPWVSPKDMKRDQIAESLDHISAEAVDESGLSIIQPGSVLVVVRGMILNHSIPVALSAVPLTINQDMKAMAPTQDLSADFLLLLLQGLKSVLFNYIDTSAHGTKKLEWDRFKNVRISFPSLSEQVKVVEAVHNSLARLDQLSADSATAIRLLKERRAALISAAVTGKIDVRGWRQNQSSQPAEWPQAAEEPAGYG